MLISDDEKIVEAMCDAAYAISPCGPKDAMRAALAVARQHIEPHARAKAMDDVAARCCPTCERKILKLKDV